MPYRFEYESTIPGNEAEFSGWLNCGRCAYINVNKNPPARCRRNVCIGLDICWQHLEQVKHLKIRQSGIQYAGKGLYAFDKRQGPNAIIFQPNHVICEYIGEVLNTQQMDARYGDQGTAPYAMQTSRNNRFIDCAIERGVGALINHAPPDEANCDWRKIRNSNRVFIVANRQIQNTRELFISYGAAYNFNPENERYSTKYKRG